jgi:hypothetical protein
VAGSSLQEKVMTLFKDYDLSIREVIADVLIVEQEHLSMINPRGVVEKIEDIVDRVAKHETR